MLRPEVMCKVNILLLNRDVAEVTRRLGEGGAVHLVDAVPQSPGHLLEPMEDGDAAQRAARLLESCRQLMHQLDITELSTDAPLSGEAPSLDAIEARLHALRGQYEALNVELASALEHVNGLSQQRSRLASYPVQDVSLDVLRGLSHIHILAGSVPESSLEGVKSALKDTCVVSDVAGCAGGLVVVCSAKDATSVESVLDGAGFMKMSEPEGFSGTATDECRQLDVRLQELRRELEEKRGRLQALGESSKIELSEICRQLAEQTALQDVRSHYGRTKSLVCISGWVPRDQVCQVESAVESVTSGTGVVEVIEAGEDVRVRLGEEAVPTKLSGHPIAAPFRNLIVNFGIPQYGEVEPTLFVGLTFVLLFGYMFGDVGHGLVFLLLGLAMRHCRGRLFESNRENGWLMILCGLCAMVFGVFYGSIFGYEELFPALWLHPMHGADVTRLLLTAIGVGTVFTSVAIILNIVNHIRSKSYYEGTFHRFGVLGLLFFWAVLGLGVWVLTGHGVSGWMAVPLLVPMGLVMFREPLHHVLHGHSPFHGSGVIGTVLEVCIEGLEIVTGYFSGTLSFIRVGAFAISHAALCYAVYMIQGILVELSLPLFCQILVLVVGNLLVIGFEGMVAMIQCVRLEYYELFGKYFIGGGVAYKPFRLPRGDR